MSDTARRGSVMSLSDGVAHLAEEEQFGEMVSVMVIWGMCIK